MKAGLPAAFANAATRRDPTTGEISGGFPCGPLDIELFDELFYRSTQAGIEIAHAIEQSGQTPDEGDLTQLWQAIRGVGSRMTVVTATGTTNWTVPAGVHRVHVRVWGGGGGGGGAGTGGGGAAGGSAGNYREGFVDVTPGAVIPITIGAPGPGGNGTPTAGGNGGSSSFGSSITASGGIGGNGAAGGSLATGAPQATGGGGGSLLVRGAGSNPGLDLGGTKVGSAGGGAFCSGTTVAIATSLGNGPSYPGGGGGGGGGGSNADGADGAPGLVILTY